MNESKEEIIEILMKRDNLTREKASSFLNDTIDIIKGNMRPDGSNADEIEEIWIDETGLEIDYLFNILLFCNGRQYKTN